MQDVARDQPCHGKPRTRNRSSDQGFNLVALDDSGVEVPATDDEVFDFEEEVEVDEDVEVGKDFEIDVYVVSIPELETDVELGIVAEVDI